jgi:hypothetical protein
MKEVIKINLIGDIKTLIDALKRSGESIAGELSNAIDLVSGLQLSEDELLPDVAEQIALLWADPILKVIYQQANSIGLGDNAGFFLDNVARIANPSYVPTDEDIVKSRIRTTGIACSRTRPSPGQRIRWTFSSRSRTRPSSRASKSSWC